MCVQHVVQYRLLYSIGRGRAPRNVVIGQPVRSLNLQSWRILGFCVCNPQHGVGFILCQRGPGSEAIDSRVVNNIAAEGLRWEKNMLERREVTEPRRHQHLPRPFDHLAIQKFRQSNFTVTVRTSSMIQFVSIRYRAAAERRSTLDNGYMHDIKVRGMLLHPQRYVHRSTWKARQVPVNQ